MGRTVCDSKAIPLRKGRKKGRVEVLLTVGLDFALADYRSECLAAAFIKPNREFVSLSVLVFLSCHLPGFLGLHDFLLTFRTFRHG